MTLLRLGSYKKLTFQIILWYSLKIYRIVKTEFKVEKTSREENTLRRYSKYVVFII